MNDKSKVRVADSAGLSCSFAAEGGKSMKDSDNKGKGPITEGRLKDARDEMSLRGHV